MSAIALEQHDDAPSLQTALPAEATIASSGAAEPHLHVVATAEESLIHTEFVDWIEKSEPKNLMCLPFDCSAHITDQYEVALVALHKKRWSFGKIRFFHFFIYAPILELPIFGPSEKITWLGIVERLIAIVMIIGSIFAALYGALLLTGYMELLPILAPMLGATVFAFHYLMARDAFRYWKNAYDHIDHAYLKSLLKKKSKKRSKKKS